MAGNADRTIMYTGITSMKLVPSDKLKYVHSRRHASQRLLSQNVACSSAYEIYTYQNVKPSGTKPKPQHKLGQDAASMLEQIIENLLHGVDRTAEG